MNDYGEQMAELWATAYLAGEDRWSHAESARQTSTAVLASLSPGSRILDVGTGRGVDAVRYAAAGHAVTGIDIVALPEWPGISANWPNARFEQCALLDHEAAEHYDVVVDAGCFHHQSPDVLGAYLGALRSLLRPTGTVWLATLCPRTPENPYAPEVAVPQPDGSYTLAFREDAIASLLAEARLTVTATSVMRRGRRNGLDDLLVRAAR